MPLILHLIWIGGPLRDLEIDTARGLLYAAKIAGAKVNFFVDDASKHSVRALVNGMLQSHAMERLHIVSAYDFTQHVRLINIDHELESYVQNFIRLPAVRESLYSLFTQASEQELNQFIHLMIKLEHVGPGRNLAALSDILRAVAIISEGGYYADLDLKLKRGTDVNLPTPDRFRINITGQGNNLSLNNDIISAQGQDSIYLKIFSHFAKQYYYHIAADYIFQNPKKTHLPQSPLCKAIAPKYVSRFSDKRVFSRFYETHLLTGNMAISELVTEADVFDKHHSFSDTLFEGAESLSIISWQNKKSYSDDSSFQYAQNIQVRPLGGFLAKNFDEEYFLEIYLKHLFGRGASDEIVALRMIDFTRVNHLIKKVIHSLENDYIEQADAIREFYANDSKEINYDGAVRMLKTVNCLKSLQAYNPESIYSYGSSCIIYAILCEMMSVRNKLADPRQYDWDFGHQIAEYHAWCETNLSLDIQALVEVSKATRETCQMM